MQCYFVCCYFYSVYVFDTVSPQGTVITSENVYTTYGSSVNLTCSAEGGPNNAFEWIKQGDVVSNMPVLHFPRITGSDSGAYQCLVTNAAGSGHVHTVLFGMHSNL